MLFATGVALGGVVASVIYELWFVPAIKRAATKAALSGSRDGER